MVCGAVVHVASDPDHVADAAIADEAQDLGKLQLATERRAVIGVRDRFELRGPVTNHEPDRHVVGDDLPCRRTRRQPPFQPLDLCGAHDAAVIGELRLPVLAVRPAIAPQVEREDVDQGPDATVR